jgi:predicted AAA+ superfamily ATPase
MQGDAEYQKDILGPVAVHNLIIQKRELADIRSRIVDDGPKGIIDYIESTVGRHKSMRQFAHMTVNEALGGYSL